EREIVQALSTARFVGVLEKDVSFGHQGAVFSDVSSALAGSAARPALLNFVAGLGGRDISRDDVEQMFAELQGATVQPPDERVRFVGVDAWGAGELCSPRTIAGGVGNPLRVPNSKETSNG
ncbi:MAG: hypothetical protein ABSF35_22220, partial [Polyangia bacterium]